MNLSERIRIARERAGLSQEQVSEQLSVDLSDLNAWETGEREPSLAQMTRMCEILQVSSDFLLSGKDPNKLFVKKFCPNCGANLPDGVKFCPQCGYEAQTAHDPPAPVRSFRDGKRYTLVISTDQEHYKLVEEGLYLFIQDNGYVPNYQGGTLPDGRQLNGLSDKEKSNFIRDFLWDFRSEKNAILCRNLPYDKALKALDIFNNRASVFVFCDNDGVSLDQLANATPVKQYELGPLSFSSVKNQWHSAGRSSLNSAVPPTQTSKENSHGCLIALACTALVLLIIVLVFSLL